MTWVADVLAVLDLAEAAGARLWIDGGWGVDALLGERTRRHGDLDVVVEGRGVIGGREVECVSAEWAVRFHDEYTGDADDRADVRALCARFGPDGEGCEPRAKSEPGESQCGVAVRHFVVS
uniref:nucleotidyltransferase domain-containing protein n=1 Tax=Actinosynnema sp. TaxID=1872144 RepID=UPI003F87D29B